MSQQLQVEVIHLFTFLYKQKKASDELSRIMDDFTITSNNSAKGRITMINIFDI